MQKKKKFKDEIKNFKNSHYSNPQISMREWIVEKASMNYPCSLVFCIIN
jgi:hypothetical protein